MTGITYEYVGGNHEESHRYLFPRVSELLRDRGPGTVVFDLGCGNGSFLSLFRDRGWRLFGSDFSPTGIAFAQQHFPGIDFFLADAESPSGDLLERVGQVDVVITTEVIEHLYDPRGFLRNARALLKPGGTLILTTPYHGYWKNLLLAVTGKMDEHFTALWDHGHIKFWSSKTMRQALGEAGFVGLEITGAGRPAPVWKSMVVRARAGSTPDTKASM